jgi:hypothetical protein
VGRALNNPEILKACIPGCESLTVTSPIDLAATVVVKVGPVKPGFRAKSLCPICARASTVARDRAYSGKSLLAAWLRHPPWRARRAPGPAEPPQLLCEQAQDWPGHCGNAGGIVLDRRHELGDVKRALCDHHPELSQMPADRIDDLVR